MSSSVASQPQAKRKLVKSRSDASAPPPVPKVSPSVLARRRRIERVLEEDIKRWREAWEELAKR